MPRLLQRGRWKGLPLRLERRSSQFVENRKGGYDNAQISSSELRRRSAAMVLGLRRGKDGSRRSGPCPRATPLRHRGGCGFTVAGADNRPQPSKPPNRPNYSPIRLRHGNTRVILAEHSNLSDGPIFIHTGGVPATLPPGPSEGLVPSTEIFSVSSLKTEKEEYMDQSQL